MLAGYARGIFPMARTRDDPVLHWVNPRFRGMFDLDGFHVSRSLRRAILRGDYTIRVDSDFAGTVAACAARSETWINAPLVALYAALHARGAAHSLEVWDGARMIGGVFGLTIGAAFFGESMFSRRTDASKIALAYVVDRLRQGGFRLFDTQFLTPHLASLGAVEVPRDDYLARLAGAIAGDARFDTGPPPAPQVLVQRMTQTS